MSEGTVRWNNASGVCEEMHWDGSKYERVIVDVKVPVDTMLFPPDPPPCPERRLRVQGLLRLSRRISSYVDWRWWLLRCEADGEFDSLIGQVYRERFGDRRRIEEYLCHDKYLESRLRLAEQHAKLNATLGASPRHLR